MSGAALLLGARQRALAAAACASFNFCAHSSQQTSTVLPPIVTAIAFSSNG
jgi:hypothetical protein